MGSTGAAALASSAISVADEGGGVSGPGIVPHSESLNLRVAANLGGTF